MTKLRFNGTMVIGAVFIGVLIHYAFFQTFIPGAVRKAFPPEYKVCQAGSLEEFLQSPLCAQLDRSLGAGNTLRELLASSNWSKLAVPSEIAVANMPYRQAGQSKAWVAASWVGWRSPWLRWKLDHVSDRTLQPLKSPFVWPVWKYESQDIARGSSIYFALTDNLFLACLSERPEDILRLLNAYDWQCLQQP